MNTPLDASGPWLAPLQPALDVALAAWRAGATVAEALHAARPAGNGAPQLAAGTPQFVPQTALPADEPYEAFIHRTAAVPTRDNGHDFFNGLVWLAHPEVKRRLNALQAAEIRRCGVTARRGRLRDALTLFDENGALLTGPPALLAALQARDWPGLFVQQRALWAQAHLLVFGHALLDQLASAPRKPLTAHVLLADPLVLDEAGWAAKPFAPLPVLGVPGWWPGNDDPRFYADVSVFRPASA